MIPAALTVIAWGFSWVALSLVLLGAWCAAIELARWQQRRKWRRRQQARGGWLYDREHDRVGL